MEGVMENVGTMQEYGYENAGETLYFSLDLAKARRVALSTSSLIALALFLGVAYFAFEKAERFLQALIAGAVAWGIFVLVRSSE